jgi:hypothetical protein
VSQIKEGIERGDILTLAKNTALSHNLSEPRLKKKWICGLTTPLQQLLFKLKLSGQPNAFQKRFSQVYLVSSLPLLQGNCFGRKL